MVERTGILLHPDYNRVLMRAFEFGSESRMIKIMARVSAMTDEQVDTELAQTLASFGHRHKDAPAFFDKRFQEVKHHLLTDVPVSKARATLIGAYFTSEYSLESAALFNPSLVWHPDQTDVPAGSVRFILSLRAVGEGHVSSIVFRCGVIHEDYSIEMYPISRFVNAPDLITNQVFDKALFESKLFELNIHDSVSDQVMEELDATFTFASLQQALLVTARRHRINLRIDPTAKAIMSLALGNYEVHFPDDLSLSERIIFPTSPNEMHGIEDARFVRFVDEGGQVTYYATYTAYDGQYTFPQILETKDFLHFKVNTLNGPEVQNKGMALFPRKIGGKYAMISRQDGENVFLMYSDHLHFWRSKRLIIKPTYPWEFVQLGNCGSPIETEEGWLMLTHGVGPMRHYVIGAVLLDLDDPSKVIGRLREPLLSPNEHEREGYVPNVVYSCGAGIYKDMLVLPYAMADYASSIALVPMKELLAKLKSDYNA